MPVALLLALQSAPVAGPPLPIPDKPRRVRDCPAGDSEYSEVVVCGRPDQDQYRLKPLPSRYADSTLPRAEVALGDGKLAADVEQVGVGGFPSNRIMLRFKLPF